MFYPYYFGIGVENSFLIIMIRFLEGKINLKERSNVWKWKTALSEKCERNVTNCDRNIPFKKNKSGRED